VGARAGACGRVRTTRVTGSAVDRIRITVTPVPRIFVLLGGAVVIVTGGLMGLRRAVEGSPRYSLRQVGVALRQHNGTKLAYYMDAARITDQLVDETVDWLAAERGIAGLPAADLDGDGRMRAAKIQSVKMALDERVGRSLAAAISVNGASDGAEDAMNRVAQRIVRTLTTAPPLNAITAGDVIAVQAIGSPEYNHQAVTAPLTVRDEDLGTTAHLSLVLARAPGRWQVVGVKGVADALEAIDNAQLERLAIVNRPIEDQLRSSVAIGEPVVDRLARGRRRTVIRLRLAVTNASPNTVSGLTLALAHRASDDEHAELLDAPAAIRPGATATETWAFDETGAATSRVASLLTHPDRLRIHVRGLVVDSAGVADTVRIFPSYAEAHAALGGQRN
jgi:hypothetical protein